MVGVCTAPVTAQVMITLPLAAVLPASALAIPFHSFAPKQDPGKTPWRNDDAD